MSGLIIDIIIGIVLLLSFGKGYHRGLILSVFSLLSVFVALFGAVFLANRLTLPVTEQVVPFMERVVHDYMETVAPNSGPGLELLGGETVLEFLRQSPIFGGFVDAIRAALGDTITQAADQVIAAAAKYLAAHFVHTVLFVLGFTIILIAWSVLAHALNVAVQIPILNAMNRWGGAFFGLLKGGLLVFIVVWLVGDQFITPEMIEGTHLLHFFATTNPVDVIGQLGLPEELKETLDQLKDVRLPDELKRTK